MQELARFQRDAEVLVSEMEEMHKELFAISPKTHEALRELMEIRLQMKLTQERNTLAREKWQRWTEFKATHEGIVVLLGVASTFALTGVAAVWVSWVVKIILRMWGGGSI